MNILNLFVICFIAVSCAYTGMELVPEKMQPLEDFATVTMVSGNAVVFDIGEVIDTRTSSDQVGMGKTGLSNLATPIVIQGGTTSYVKSRLLTGLRKRGVSVRDGEKTLLSAKILDLWVGESSNENAAENSVCKMKLEFSLTLKEQALPKWTGIVAVEAGSKGTIFDATDLNGPMLESCMNEVIEKLIRDKKFQNITGIKI